MINKIQLKYWLFIVGLLISLPAISQDDILSLLDEEQNTSNIQYIQNTFKGTRLINGHSTELQSKGVLEFLISHRFGRLNSGIYDFFGLDDANIRLGLDYGISDRLSVGAGRSSYEKVYDGFVKYQLVRQSTGMRKAPITVTLFGSTSVKTLKSPDSDTTIPFEQKLAYTTQLLIARKFSEKLSLQLVPSLVHRNYVSDWWDENTIIALGFGGRYKISKRIALTGEYYYRFMGRDASNISDSFSLGVDIETGGHVFQLIFTNSRQMNEKGFITETDGQWQDADVHFGFNISRVFYLNTGKKK